MGLRSIVEKAFSVTVDYVTRREYHRQAFRRNERPIDLRFIFECITRIAPRNVLDVGTGISPLPALIRNCGLLVTATDNIVDYWPRGFVNRHYHVINDNIVDTKLTDRFDLVICAGVLQHVKEHERAVRSMFSLLRPHGYLIVSCPYNEREYVPNAYALPQAGYGQQSPYVCQQHNAEHRDRWVGDNGAELVIQEHWQVFAGEYWTYGEALEPPKQVHSDETHQFTCMLLRGR